MKNFVTIFMQYKDVHFFKDPGQIPYWFSKLGYSSSIVCYKNENKYKNTKKYITLKTITNNSLTRKFNSGIILFLIFNAHKIDVLNLFHLNWNSLLFAFCYKMINPRGFTYLKLDNCYYSMNYPWEKIFNPDIPVTNSLMEKDSKKTRLKNYLAKKYFIKKIDLWSVEDEGSKHYYEKQYTFFKNRLITVYNGHAIDLIKKKIQVKSFSKKENIMFSVGRFGTFPKATEVLFEAFKMITNKCDWQLHLAGTLTSSFEKFTEKYFKENPYLKERVIFHGFLEKNDLSDLYNRSKIFCLPSRWEGFSLVFPEAMYFRNAIITTPYTSVKDLIEKKELGLIVEKDDSERLAIAMIELINNQKLNERYATNARQFAVKNLGWDKITNELKNEIEQMKLNK